MSHKSEWHVLVQYWLRHLSKTNSLIQSTCTSGLHCAEIIFWSRYTYNQANVSYLKTLCLSLQRKKWFLKIYPLNNCKCAKKAQMLSSKPKWLKSNHRSANMQFDKFLQVISNIFSKFGNVLLNEAATVAWKKRWGGRKYFTPWFYLWLVGL